MSRCPQQTMQQVWGHLQEQRKAERRQRGWRAESPAVVSCSAELEYVG